MSRIRQARRIAAAAAFGGGGLAGIGAAGIGVLLAEARLARRWIGTPYGTTGPDASGRYGAGTGEPIELAMLGDSTSVGLGVGDVETSPGAVIARGVAALSGRPVRLVVAGRVGADSGHLDGQIDDLLDRGPAPDVAVIMVGANDVTHRLVPSESVRHLDGAVRRLRALDCEVVVGTCPDLGTIEPMAQPLRYVARRWSRRLAAAQTIAAVEAGGRSVSVADLMARDLATRKHEMFAADRFHPSEAGYARLAAVLLPSVCAAIGVLPDGAQRPDVRRGEGVDDVAHAAVRAASAPGTEVSGVEVSGAARGPRGRWAVLLRRRLPVARASERGRDGERDGRPDPGAGEQSPTTVGS